MNITILDCYNLMHRARFGMRHGDNHIVFNFFRGLRPIIEKLESNKVFLVLEGIPLHRQKADPEYKANRIIKEDSPKWDEMKEFHRQKKIIFDLVKHLPITITRHPNLECDDVAASIALKHVNDICTIVSTDTDFMQLLPSKNIRLYNPVKKEFIQPTHFDYLTWKILRGDKTDNVPGIPGMSDKKAETLLAESGALSRALLDPGFAAAFKKNKELIEFKVIESNDELLESSSYESNLNDLYQNFVNLKFHSMTNESSWKKYTKTLDTIYSNTQ